MRIAGSIILGVIGAILYFAVSVDVAGVSLPTVGIILLVAAGIWFLIELIRGFAGERTRSTSTIRDADGSVKQQETAVRETRVRNEP